MVLLIETNKKMGVEVLIQPTKKKIVKCGRRRSRI